MQILPFVPSIPFYRFTTTIDSTNYIFDVRWNSRSERWAIDISEENGTSILHGGIIVLGAAIGRTSTHLLLMSGVIVARDTTMELRDPGLDDLGTRVKVYYIPRDDMANEIVAAATGSPVESLSTETANI